MGYTPFVFSSTYVIENIQRKILVVES